MSIQAAVDDPKWVLDKYREAKEIVDDLRADIQIGRATVESDIEDRLDDFWAVTFMDRCTTLGLDCGCNDVSD